MILSPLIKAIIDITNHIILFAQSLTMVYGRCFILENFEFGNSSADFL